MSERFWQILASDAFSRRLESACEKPPLKAFFLREKKGQARGPRSYIAHVLFYTRMSRSGLWGLTLKIVRDAWRGGGCNWQFMEFVRRSKTTTEILRVAQNDGGGRILRVVQNDGGGRILRVAQNDDSMGGVQRRMTTRGRRGRRRKMNGLQNAVVLVSAGQRG